MRNTPWSLKATLVALATSTLLGTSAVCVGDDAAGTVRIGVLNSRSTNNPDSAPGKVRIGVLESRYARTVAMEKAAKEGETPPSAMAASNCDACGGYGQGCDQCCEDRGYCRLGSCLSRAFDTYDDCWYRYGDGWYECANGCCYGGHGGECYGDCNECEDDGSCLNSRRISHFRARNELASRRLKEHIHDRLAYFHPSGCGGAGCPPFGHYHRTYAVNPSHFDARDGRVYAAQGTGMPMAVPLAPNVNYTYNYGWGVPSSRLTQVSRPQPFNPIIYP